VTTPEWLSNAASLSHCRSRICLPQTRPQQDWVTARRGGFLEQLMPRRTLLSAEARSRLLGIPTKHGEMVQHCVLDAADLALVRARHRAANRLGFAVQLCLLRHPGTGLGPTTTCARTAPPISAPGSACWARRFIFVAAAHAQRACDFLWSLQPEVGQDNDTVTAE
jgi:hypothetical protein